MKRFLFVLIPIFALIISACSQSVSPTPSATPNLPAPVSMAETSGLERSDQQGAVTVTVLPTNLDDPGKTIDFDISLQTHSVELDMDLTKLATLKTDTGQTVQATTYSGGSGGHHVKGVLSFPAEVDGKPIMEGAKTVTLTIQNVDAPERIFEWQITP